VALVITALLNAQSVPAWWVVPVTVVVIIGVSLRRASRA